MKVTFKVHENRKSTRKQRLWDTCNIYFQMQLNEKLLHGDYLFSIDFYKKVMTVIFDLIPSC